MKVELKKVWVEDNDYITPPCFNDLPLEKGGFTPQERKYIEKTADLLARITQPHLAWPEHEWQAFLCQNINELRKTANCPKTHQIT